VAYNDRECQNIPRQVCQWVPPRPHCEQIPYEDRVCQDETRYRQEPYACTRTIQVPYSVVVKRFEAATKVAFDSARNTDARAQFTVSLSNKGEMDMVAKSLSPNHLWVATRQVTGAPDGEDMVRLNALFSVDVLPMAILSPVSKPIEDLKAKKRQLSFKVAKVERPDLLRLRLKIERKGEVVLDKVLMPNDLQIIDEDGGSRITIDLGKQNTTIKWAHRYQVSLDLRVEFRGKVLNNPVPAVKQQYADSVLRIFQ